MASDVDFVRFVVDQIDASCDVSYRKMFGEYALYSRGKVVALICDNQLFVKPTEAGREFVGQVIESSPYPGAKPAFLIEDELEDDGPGQDYIFSLRTCEYRSVLPDYVFSRSN